MILESTETARIFGNSGQDAVMGCDFCCDRITGHYPYPPYNLCVRCAYAWTIGFNTGMIRRRRV